MKIYNPITKGKRIEIDDFVFNVDSYKVIENEQLANKLLKRYPFLIDIDQPKYKPSFNDIKISKWDIIKIKLLRMLLKLQR